MTSYAIHINSLCVPLMSLVSSDHNSSAKLSKVFKIPTENSVIVSRLKFGYSSS